MTSQSVSKTRILCAVRMLSNSVQLKLGSGETGLHLEAELYASELRLRGDDTVVQPHRDEKGNVLCWNGEIFDGISVDAHENDGARLFACLGSTSSTSDVVDLLGTFEGPYALVYYQAANNRLLFARDPLGRRSLLIHAPSPENPHFVLTSVSAGSHDAYEFDELSTDHIFSLELDCLVDATTLQEGYRASIHQLPRCSRNPSQGVFAEPASLNRAIPHELPLPMQSLETIPPHLSQSVDALISELDRSVQLRVQNIPRRFEDPGMARVAVLFSGGIDCTALAFFAHRHVPLDEPIDLLNVAFENPRTIRARGDTSGETSRQAQNPPSTYMVPDRATGIAQVDELRRICPGRTWNFVEVDVPYAESQAARPIVEALMFPRQTVMDLSLAIALYFAARGVGHIKPADGDNAAPSPYTSPARVLLSGLGADELLGGYGRHRTAFERGSWPALVDELHLDLARLPTRNLGRDDRVVAAHGKELRLPFLSLSVVARLAALPAHVKADPRAPPGVGDKMLLRLAVHRCGLVEASARRKRAMQFGSRSARMEGGKGERRGTQMLE